MNTNIINNADENSENSIDRNNLNSFLINICSDLILTFDNNNIITNVNNSFCNLFHFNSEQIIGKTFLDIGLPAYFCGQWVEFTQIVFTSQTQLSKGSCFTMPDGINYSLNLTFYPIFNNQQKINGIAVVANNLNIIDHHNELKLNNNEYYDIIDNTPDLIGIHSNGLVVFINKKGVEILKAKSKEEILGKNFMQFVHPDYVEIVKQRASEVVKKGETTPLEEKLICIDGSYIDVEVKAIPIVFNNQNAVLIIARDISEKKFAQEELKAERTLLRTIIDSVPESVYVKDAKGGKVIANTQDLRYMGLDSEKEALGKTDEEVYAKYNSAYFNKDDQFVMQDGKPLINKLDYFIDANNQQYWLLTSKVPIRNKDNEIIGLIGIGRDVSEIQKIQEQLFETQKRMNEIILCSSDWIWEVDSNGDFTYCSDNIETIFGLKSTELMGKSLFSIIPEIDNLVVKEIFSKQEHIVDLENWIYHTDGSKRCLLTNGFPTYDKSGLIKGYTGVIKDITDRKSKESKISELNESLNTLIEAMPDAVFFKDHLGRWLITNTAAKKLFNLDESSWIGKTDNELAAAQPLYADAYASCLRTDNEAWDAGKLTLSSESVYDTEGNCFQYHVSKIPIFEANGHKKGLVIIGRDITKIKLEEQRLKLLETVIDHASDAITIVEINQEDIKKSAVIFVNNACCKITGLTNKDYIGSPPLVMQNTYLDNSLIENISKAILKGEPIKFEMNEKKHNGEEFYSIFSITPVSNKEGKFTHWIGIKKDITEAKKHEQEIKKAIIMGQENEKYYISGELHDNVAQILVGARLSLSLVKGKTDKEVEWLKQTHENINSAINEIRNLSHSLAPSAFYQKDLISSIEQLLKSINKENRYDIVFHAHNIENAEMSGEIQLNIYRILQEQLQNIIKHAEANKIEVQIQLVEDNIIKMKIIDNGKGFDTNSHIKGIGLLNIKNRAETFSGIYSIKSSPGNGCELNITIPIN